MYYKLWSGYGRQQCDELDTVSNTRKYTAVVLT